MNYETCMILEDELPVKAGLIVIRRNDPNYGLSPEEIQDRAEFIRCYLLDEFRPLMAIPQQFVEDDFFFSDHAVSQDEYSAFDTYDFHRLMRPLNKYGYAIRKIYERVKDLAILHSSVSDMDSRDEIHEKFLYLVNRKFRDRLLSLAEQHRKCQCLERRSSIKHKIGQLNRHIMECEVIWRRYAPPENWDC